MNVEKHKSSRHEGIRFPCDKFDFTATEKCHLTKHMKRTHIVIVRNGVEKVMLEEVRVPCDICDFSTTSNSHLKQHKKNKDEGVRNPVISLIMQRPKCPT